MRARRGSMWSWAVGGALARISVFTPDWTLPAPASNGEVGWIADERARTARLRRERTSGAVGITRRDIFSLPCCRSRHTSWGVGAKLFQAGCRASRKDTPAISTAKTGAARPFTGLTPRAISAPRPGVRSATNRFGATRVPYPSDRRRIPGFRDAQSGRRSSARSAGGCYP